MLLVAPGSGLGHVVRACALCLRLGELGIGARIATSSAYAEGLARLTGCPIDQMPSAGWKEGIPRYVAELRPRLVVLDSFPWGLRGEWAGVRLPGVRFVYLARRLRVQAYLDALGMDWEPGAPQVARAIAIEPLGADHAARLGGEVAELPGRIRFPANAVRTPLPEPLERLLAAGPTWLVVHSGPRHEVQTLVRSALAAMHDAGGRLALIAPVPPDDLPCPWFDYFPASALFDRAHRVVSGAGYNMMAEMAERRGKHLAIAFRRRYDDQEARLAGPSPEPVDGGPAAARALAAWL